jgi:hypothetical protein
MRGLNNVPNLLNKNNPVIEKPGNFIINDIELHVPPTAISVHKEGLHYSMKALRTKVTTKILSGSGVYHAQVKITFPQDSLVLLHRLICEVKNSPFISVKNKFISDSMGRNLPGMPDTQRRVESFTVMGLQITNHPSSPNAFLCELDLRLFNHKPYTRYFGYRKEFLDKIDGKYYAHPVFDYNNVKNKILLENIFEENTNEKTSTRLVGQAVNASFDPTRINNFQSNILIKDARDSNAYKRYANYLQVKSLADNFGIYIDPEAYLQSTEVNVIGISHDLKHCFEQGYSDGGNLKKVFGLHEFVKVAEKAGRNLFKESIEFRNAIIEKMLLSSKTVNISYKEFYKYVGDEDFLRKYRNSLETGIAPGTNQTQEEKAKIRRKNKNIIDNKFLAAMRGDFAKEVAADDTLKVETASFKQVDISERLPDTSNHDAKANRSYSQPYPLVLEANYRFLFNNNYLVTSMYSEASTPIFCPIDNAQVNFEKESSTLTISNDKDTFKIKPIAVNGVEPLKVFEEDILSIEINKGDIVGYILSSTKLEVKTSRDLIKDYQISSSENLNEQVANLKNKKFFGELTYSDLEEIQKFQKALSEGNYSLNTTRSTVQQIFERVITHDYGIVNTEEAISHLIRGKGENPRLFEKPTVVTNISGNIRHIMASIPIVGLEHPTHQYLGSIEPNYQISFIGKTSQLSAGQMPEALRELESIRNLMMFNSKNFAFIPDSGNIYVKSFITKIMGSEEVLNFINDEESTIEELSSSFYPNIVMSSTDTFTVEGSPGVTGMHVRFAESKSFTEEKVAPARTTQVNEDFLDAALKEYKLTPKSESGVEFFETTPYNAEGEKKDLLKWKTKNITSFSWYRHSTNPGRKKSKRLRKDSQKDLALDNNAFLFAKEYLQPLQDILSNYENENENEKKYTLKLKSTFDDPVGTHRTTKSNHFANVAADIYVPGMNAMELAGIILVCLETGYIEGKSLRGSESKTKSIRNAGLGIYGSEASDYDTKMSGRGAKSHGFIHLDANFLISLINDNDGKVVDLDYSPRSDRWRVWVGEKADAAFRLNNLNQGGTARKFWGYGGTSYADSHLKAIIADKNIQAKVIAAISKLNQGNATVEEQEEQLESLPEEDLDSNEEESNVVSGKQSSLREDEIIYTRAGIAEHLGLKENDLNILEYKEVQTALSQNDLSANKDFTYISIPKITVFRDPNARGEEEIQRKRREAIKEKIKSTKYLTVEKDNLLYQSIFSNKNYGLVLKVRNNKLKSGIRQKANLENTEMLNNFQLLASRILTEPHLYLDESEALEELKRINKEIGLDVVPSLYSSLELGSVGRSHTAENAAAYLKELNISRNIYSGAAAGSAVGGAVWATTAANTALNTAIASILAPIPEPAHKVGGLILLSGALISVATLSTISYLSNYEIEDESYALQQKRIAGYLKSSDRTEEYYVHLVANMKKLSLANQDEYDRGIISEKEKEIKTTFEKLSNSIQVRSGISNFLKLVFSENKAFKYFDEIRQGLRTDSLLKSFLSIESQEKVEGSTQEGFLGNTLILEGGDVESYLYYLFGFPYEDKTFGNNEFAREVYYISDSSKVNYLEDPEDYTIPKEKTLFKKQIGKSNQPLLSDFFTEKRKSSIKRNQENKIAWLKGVLKSIVESKIFLDDNKEIKKIRDELEASQNIFDSDTYPDITLPPNPKVSYINRKLDPSFYYWSSKGLNQERKKKLEESNKKEAEAVLNKSLEFERNITKGIYTGPKRFGKNKEGEASIDVDTFASNKDISLYSINNYTFLDKVDDGNEVELSANTFSNIVARQITAETNLPKVKREYDDIIKEMKGQTGTIPLTNNKSLTNELGAGLLPETLTENNERIFSTIEDSFKEFYSNDDMIKAYPTFKLYLIEEDAEVSDSLVAFDDFYYYNNVISFKFNNSRELPAQTATIQLQNISGTLDGTKKGELRDIDINRDTRNTPYQSDDNILVDSIVLRPGINIQLRAGYGAHSKDLSVLLNGTVTEVNYSSDNMVASITVQSFGVELDSNFKNVYAEGNNYKFQTTGEVLASLVYSEELKHFGKIKKGKIFPYGQSSFQKVLDIEEGMEDVSYTYSLTKGALTFFEKHGEKILWGLIIVEALAPFAKVLKFKIPGVGKVFDNVARSVSKYGDDLSGAHWFIKGSAALFINPAKFLYTKTNRLLGRNYYLKDKGISSQFIRHLGRGKDVADAARDLNLTKYQTNRLLGKGILSSIFSKIPVGNISDDLLRQIKFKYVYQTHGFETALRASGTGVGYNYGTYMSLLYGRTKVGTSFFNLFFNAFNIIPKTLGLAGAAVSTAAALAAIGMIVDAGANLVSSDEDYAFQRKLKRLRKRIILSPTDDNLFPPAKESYISGSTSKREENYSKLVKNLLKSTGKNLTVGWGVLISAISGSEDKSQSIETIIKNKVALSNKMMRGIKESEFIINNQSTWDVLKELSYRHPGYIYAIRPYGEKFEYRIFFGKPNQRYYSDSITNSDAEREQTLQDLIVQMKENREPDLEKLKELYPGVMANTVVQKSNLAREVSKRMVYEEFLTRTRSRFKPFRMYHSVDSHRNLIANNIITSGHNVINTVDVHTVIQDDTSTSEPSKDDVYTVRFKASRNIPRELEKTKTLQMENIRGVSNANRYGISELIYSSKEMYTGSLLILGDDKINPWDIIILKDRVNNISGPVEVKAVTHMFSHETGFLTDIEVNAVVSANDFLSLPALHQTFIHETRRSILENYSSRSAIGFTGNENLDKALLKKELIKAARNMSSEERKLTESALKGIVFAGSQPGTVVLKNLFVGDGEEAFEGKAMEEVVNRLYESYKDPESFNFYEDVLDGSGTEITEEIATGASSVETAAGGILLGLGATVIAKNAYSFKGGFKKLGSRSKVGAAVGALLLLDSYTSNIFGSGVAKVSRNYFDDYLEENLAKPFILSKTTEESVIRIAPLIKDGEALLSGGYEKVGEEEKWKYMYGNFFNNMSDGYRGYLRNKKLMHSAGTNVLNNLDDYSFIEKANIAITGGVGGKKLVGYFYGEDES